MSCDGHVRHWFTLRGLVGVRSPVCVRHGCEAVNPRPLDDEEWDEWALFVGHERAARALRLVGR